MDSAICKIALLRSLFVQESCSETLVLSQDAVKGAALLLEEVANSLAAKAAEEKRNKKS